MGATGRGSQSGIGKPRNPRTGMSTLCSAGLFPPRRAKPPLQRDGGQLAGADNFPVARCATRHELRVS